MYLNEFIVNNFVVVVKIENIHNSRTSLIRHPSDIVFLCRIIDKKKSILLFLLPTVMVGLRGCRIIESNKV